MTVERLHPSGDYLISDIVDGEYLKYRYSDYTKKEAIALFKEFVKMRRAERAKKKV